MLYATGDIWKVEGNWRVIPTNGYVNKKGECVMGRGIALQAKLKYPKLPLELGALIKIYGNNVYLLRPYHLISFPVKAVWWSMASTELIDRSCQQLVRIVAIPKEDKILVPLVGCGNGKLHRDQVFPILYKHLDDRFTLVEQLE